jgi:hypothetical protein
MGSVVEILRERSRWAVAAATVATATLALCPPPAAAGLGANLHLRIVSADQHSLTATHGFDVYVTGRGGGARVKLESDLGQGGERVTAAHPKRLRLLPGQSRSATLKLNAKGRSLVQSCLKTKLRVVARVRSDGRWRKSAEAQKAMTRDPALCQGTSRSVSTWTTRPSATRSPQPTRASASSPIPTTTTRRRTRKPTPGSGSPSHLTRPRPTALAFTSTRLRSTPATASARGRPS